MRNEHFVQFLKIYTYIKAIVKQNVNLKLKSFVNRIGKIISEKVYYERERERERERDGKILFWSLNFTKNLFFIPKH